MLKNSTNEEFEYPTNIIVYPNPFINNTTLSFDLNKSSNINLMIYDIQGNLINIENYNLSTGTQTIKIDLTGQLPMNYYLVITMSDSDGKIFIKRLILNKVSR